MLPVPTFSFTIPSVHDDILLDCRVYHPTKFLQSGTAGETIWKKKGAIIAHPYAPLGGSYDDPVVVAAAAEILKKQFVIGTFNFRGAGCSKGRTSWTGKPELSDYISFVGFFIHYLNGLQPPAPGSPLDNFRAVSDNPLSPIQSSFPMPADAFEPASTGMVLILGGYSYGSLITTHLPTTQKILARFEDVGKGTAEAEIRLRALHLSTQWTREAQQHCGARRGRTLHVHDSSRGGSYSAIIGGEETEPASRRPSRESRRSVDLVRKSMDRSRRRLGLRTQSSDGNLPAGLEEKVGSSNLDTPTTYYLLISPLLPPISMFVTIFTKLGHTRKEDGSAAKGGNNVSATFSQGNLLTCTSLAIYGDKDYFTSQTKLRKWAEHLAQQGGSRFMFREIPNAGHFWHEEGVEAQMKDTIRDWIQDIMIRAG